jgi:hypothetical protein
MSNVSIDIKNLPLSDDINDSDLIILEKPNFTAAAPANILKGYINNQITTNVDNTTYTADEVTLTLSANQFKIKDKSIDEDQLSDNILSKLGGSTSTLSGNIVTYSTPITSVGEFLEMFLQTSPGGPIGRYAIRVYKV